MGGLPPSLRLPTEPTVANKISQSGHTEICSELTDQDLDLVRGIFVPAAGRSAACDALDELLRCLSG